MKELHVGLIGAGYICQTHATSLKHVPGASVVAVADTDVTRAQEFAQKNDLKKVYASHAELVADPDVDVVVIGLPNWLHHPVAIDALKAGKHVICEKPLALTIESAEEMIATAKSRGLVLGYAEELCFVPKYLRAKELMESGGIGRPYLLRQCEKHAGPYSAWFWKANRAGGGITMDMGCHSIECIRWAVGKKKVKSVTAHMGTYLHELNGVSGEPSEVEDFSLIIMEFEDGTLGQAESSWALKGGMDSTLDVFGTGGVIYADMLKGSAIRAFTDMGFPIAPDAGIGWTFHDWDYLWNNGYPQEDAHFLECIRTGATPMESGEDGLAVLEIMLAAYHSAGTGQRVTLPFRPRGLDCPPVDLWRKPRPQLGAGPIR